MSFDGHNWACWNREKRLKQKGWVPKARWYSLSDVYWMFLDSFLLIKVTQKFPHFFPFFSSFIHVYENGNANGNENFLEELTFVCNFRLICAHHINMRDLAIMIDLIRVWQLRDIFFIYFSSIAVAFFLLQTRNEVTFFISSRYKWTYEIQ